MKFLIYILVFLTGLVYGQDKKLTEPEIETYVKSIDKLKAKNKLQKIYYPKMSSCGGVVHGYYFNEKLVLIDATYYSELGFSSQFLYLNQDQFVKAVCHRNIAEWEKYAQNYPADKYEFDESKMTYVDTFLTVIFSDSIYSQQQPGNASVSSEVIEHLLGCGQRMVSELQEVIDMMVQIDSLKYVKEMPYMCHDEIYNKNKLSIGCGDELFWNVVKLQNYAIDFLIDKLDDSTTTEAIVPNFGYYHTTADVAYTALQEIIHNIPTFELLGVQFDEKGCGYCSYWQHLNKSYKNRKTFKAAVQKWYLENAKNLVWIKNNAFATCDCSGKHPSGGHYEIKNK